MSLVRVLAKAMDDDPVGTSLLIDEAVHSWISDELIARAGLIQPLIAADVAARTAVAKRAIGRDYVQAVTKGDMPDPEVHEYAGWLAAVDVFTTAVSKAASNDIETWQYDSGPQTRRVRRDSAGRWTKGIDQAARQPVRGVSPERLSPHLAGQVISNPKTGERQVVAGNDEDKLAAHQAQWEQAADYLASANQVFGRGANHVSAEVEFLTNGQPGRTETFTLSAGRRGIPTSVAMNPQADAILRISLTADEGADADTQAKVRTFNAMGYLNSDSLQRLMGVPTDAWAAMAGSKEPVGTRATDRLFNRMRGASDVLSAVPGADKAEAFTRLVGTLGPQAEQVMGPYVRRSAYRYRGTEKTPDADLAADFASQEMAEVRALADAGASADSKAEVLEAARQRAAVNPVGAGRQFGGDRAQQGRRPRRSGSPVVGSAALRAAQGSDTDQLKLQVASDVAAAHLMGALPADPFTAALSEKAGHVLPSQGVIINADGELVTQAVGYADDHYLPFDLKNMAALRGGQYVRTRVAGGLTGEDIYASVQGGARMATVVSSSGVFSIEFDPSFRGARGNSDKARSMYTRYLKILDAVENSNLYLQDLPPAEKSKIAAGARALMGPDDGSEQYKTDLRRETERLTERRRLEVAGGVDTEAIQTQAELIARNEPGSGQLSHAAMSRRVQDVYDELLAEESAKGVQKLRLNAAGYAKALETLQEQFPYFIRKVSYEPLRTTRNAKEASGFLDSRGLDLTRGLSQKLSSKDTGYVKPGGLRPATTAEGFYSTATGPGAKAPKGTSPAPSGDADAGQVPGGGAGPAGAAGADAKAKAPAASGGKVPALIAALADAAPRAKAQVQSDATALSAGLSQIPGGPMANMTLNTAVNPPVDMPVDEAIASGDSTVMATWLLSRPRELPGAVMAHPELAAALGDRTALSRAMGVVWPADATWDTWLENPENQALFGGATTSNAMKDHVLALAASVGAAASLTDPFGPAVTDRAQSMHYAGDKPQANSELLKYATKEQLDAFLKSDGAQLNAMAEALGPDPAAAVKKINEILAGALATRDVAWRKFTETGDPDDFMAAFRKQSPAKLDEVEGALGRPVSYDSITPESIAEAGAKWQDAWTLAQVKRSVALIDGEVGGAGPKVRKALSPRQGLRVLPPEHPAAAAVRLSKALERPMRLWR